ncbi:cation transporter [Pseudoxanthomonas broegbernensis]|uniref:Cation transporter n=1 Tax=Pseudoxanthomonas broegbernensis TaxID=83619 RepID=A0A7V8GKG5_9GAMM|nr:TolC family protein [Pseudoxanthomonas broegbernensis]KAF1684970.1 cation transporter [Pseudoxanthomonas broegbernensis]MBB6064844.1 cobalt-zinc-cadmium efflux system outer membrane protein [Pseudoxanthomonas broegbernensis]
MFLRPAARAALVTVLAWALPAHAGDRLTLDDAFARVARTHPDLRLFGPRSDVLLAELEQASLRPAMRADLELENAPGSGALHGFDGAELTLSLAGVFERGGKLDARRTLAQRRIDALAGEREAQRLDLLAETARRYLAMAAADARIALAGEDVAQRQRTVAAARKRLQAGASPESVLLTAQAALARAELDQARAAQDRDAARQHLAALWGERAPAFEVAAADLLDLPALEPPRRLAALLDATPELQQFADAQRIAEARLQLARSAARPDLDWRLGVRRLQDGGDTGLVAGLSLPLGGARHAQPEIRMAEAGLAGLEVEREARGAALYSTLVQAHGRYTGARLEAQRLGAEVLPRLERAAEAAARAYRAGAASYLEWAQLQSEHTAARQRRLEAALEARLALIELQRLTGQAFVAAADAPARGPTP